jgi:5-(carboxyamino)imidazole ribonucleotide mutase
MQAKVSIVMNSSSDLPVMEEAAKVLNDLKIPFEINILSDQRTPERILEYTREAYDRGIRVFIAGAGNAAHLPGVIAALTPLPVIGVPINSSNSLDGWDSILTILQMPSGIPVAMVAIDGARNAGILAARILGTGDETILNSIRDFKRTLKDKVLAEKGDVSEIKFEYKTN